MGICRDKATTFLRGWGYNVLRHPDDALLPLEVVGKQRKRCERLGQLRDLLDSASAEPTVQGPALAADLSGCGSSSLNLGVGAQILGAFVGAMGGTLGVSTSYTNAKRVRFEFAEVTKKFVPAGQAGTFLTSGDLSRSNPALVPWILGKGQIYLVTDVAYSSSFAVRFEQAAGQAATVNLDQLGDLAGVKVKVEASRSETHVIRFEGKSKTPLAFAFKCFEVGYLEGVLAFTSIKPGAVALSDALDHEGQPIDPGVLLADPDDVQLIEFG